MSYEVIVTLVVLALTLVSLARELFPPPATVLGAVILLLVFGVVTPQEAFSGFSNPAPITVAALYVLARAVEKTGALQPLVSATLGQEGRGRGALLRLVLPTATASSFLNNTPIVAMLVPHVTDWAEQRGQSPSCYLMPLSFASILGGMVTLIGTPPNIIIATFRAQTSGSPFGMFDFTPVGGVVAVVGVAAVTGGTLGIGDIAGNATHAVVATLARRASKSPPL